MSTNFQRIRELNGHSDLINRIAWSPTGRQLASASYDRTVRIWGMTTNAGSFMLSGHQDWVSSVAWSPNGRYLASGGGDGYVRIWDAQTGEQAGGKGFVAHSRAIFDIAWSPDGTMLATASSDKSIILWHVPTFRRLHTLQGHSDAVYALAWSPTSQEIASASGDHTVRMWDVKTGRLKRVRDGHSDAVYTLDWSSDGNILASGSNDSTIRLWGRLSGILEGHAGAVSYLAFSCDNRFMASKSLDGTVRLWRCDTWEMIEILPEESQNYWTGGLAFHPRMLALATLGEDSPSLRIWRLNTESLDSAGAVMPTVRYTNAKVVIVGDSGVGKSSLNDALLEEGASWIPQTSTHGLRVHTLNTEEHLIGSSLNEMREILLWDMAGQPGYRLIHQLHLKEVVVGLVVFDMRNETDPFAGVRHWERALRHAHTMQSGKDHHPLVTFLVAGRVDRSGVGVGPQRVNALIQERGFTGYFETSATEGWGVAELREAIHNAIEWDKLPRVTSTELFQQIKNFLVSVRESEKQRGAERVLYTVNELYDTFVNSDDSLLDDMTLRAQFETCIGLLESRGLVRHFSFGNLVLLQPELLDAYASALIAAAKDEPDGLGVMVEEVAHNGQFRLPDTERIKDHEQEKLLLIATVEDLLRHEIALRDEDPYGVKLLVFPSQSTRSTPTLPDPNDRTAIWEFEGPVLNIYTTLAVRLWHTRLFADKSLYENAATYTTTDGQSCKLYIRSPEEGKAELLLYFDASVSPETCTQIEEYVNKHLLRHALPDSVKKRRMMVCPHCQTVVPDEVVKKRREMGKDYIICSVCERRVSLVMETRISRGQTFLREVMVNRLDKEADTQRRKNMAISVLQGKMATNDYDVFLCHNNRDKERVKEVMALLMECGILPWLDEADIPPGLDWETALQFNIEKCRSLAFFVGKHGIGDFQRNELHHARAIKAKIIPVVLPGAVGDPALPISINQLQWVDFRKPTPDPLQKLIWGITGDNPLRSM